MTSSIKKILAVALVLLFSCSTAAFCAPPNAGTILREQQPQRQLPMELPPTAAQKKQPALKNTGVTVKVKAFRFTGYHGLATQKELQKLVAGAVGKRLDVTALRELTAKVTAYLRKKGWFLAQAYLPQQDVTSGTIIIAILQGTSDAPMHFKCNQNSRINQNFLQAIGDQAVQTGEPVKEQPLERSLLLMNDLPGVSAKAALSPGNSSGSTDIGVCVNEGPLFSGSVWGDNYGNRYTGSWQGNTMMNVNDPYGYGDQTSLLFTGAEGLQQGEASYSIPLSSTGLLGTLSYTSLHYNLLGDLSALDGNGDSNVVTAGLSYPLLRSRSANIWAAFNYSFLNFIDNEEDVATSNKQLNQGALSLNGNHFDNFCGGGYVTGKVEATTGYLNESGPDIGITGTQGSYTFFNFQLARLQKLTSTTTLNFSFADQLSLNNLDSSQQFILGGPYGVRAYPVGEASGDNGQLFNVDLFRDLPIPARLGTLKLDGFFDAGHITLHNDPWINSVVTATGDNSYWLKGVGLGLIYKYEQRFALSATWAHVIGGNPGRSIQNEDFDGRSLDDRFWLQGIAYF